jgi:hypothetical protein
MFETAGQTSMIALSAFVLAARRAAKRVLCPAADIRRTAEAKLIALACSPAPAGFARWSLRLLEEKVAELNIVEKASDNTIGRTLKKRP